MKIPKNIKKYTVVGILLLIYPIQGFDFENTYSCYVDFCSWTKYCDHISQRCEDCSSRFHDCFTPDQKPNCTLFCVTYQSCQPLKPLLHGHHNGSDRQEYMYGSKVSFTCEIGFQNTGVMETTCQDFGRWSHLELNESQPLCKKNKCKIPHPPAHGRVEFPPDITEFVVGSKIFYSCETGYELRGKDKYRTCLTNGKWSGTLPECVVDFCKSPTIPTNGGIIIPPGLEHFVPGTWITYTCNDGFSLKGDAKRQCLLNGVWGFNSATCVAKESSINVWMIAAISSGCLLLLISGILVFICLKLCRKGKKYEKIPETNNQTEKLKTEEETLDTTIPQTTIPPADDNTIDTKNVRSLKERKKAVLPTSEPSQVPTDEGNKTVVIENCQNVFVSNGDNNTYLADTAQNSEKESSKSVENPVTTNAVKETDQGLKTVILYDTENQGNLIAQESTSL